ncbi:Calpain-type cysteine protease ADL1, partial [Neolecta irregularis DAH-3]
LSTESHLKSTCYHKHVHPWFYKLLRVHHVTQYHGIAVYINLQELFTVCFTMSAKKSISLYSVKSDITEDNPKTPAPACRLRPLIELQGLHEARITSASSSEDGAPMTGEAEILVETCTAVPLVVQAELSNPIQEDIFQGIVQVRENSIRNPSISRLHETPRSFFTTNGLENSINETREKVGLISKECREKNRRFRDRHFDLENDPAYCLMKFGGLAPETEPAGALRIHRIFEHPQIFVNGVSAGDIVQGGRGNSWFLSAAASIASIPGMIERICVARDEEIGIYGFVFFKDGEWISSIVDDFLFVKSETFEQAQLPADRHCGNPKRMVESSNSRGSSALFFSQCADDNETWLPLLEKAYAKAHGDYQSLYGGYPGDGIEDLSGGVTDQLSTSDILDEDAFWTNELLRANKDLLFSCWVAESHGEAIIGSNGLVHNHAYSVLKAVEIKGRRLLMIRNPWGNTEWKGRWSDGSSQWTPEWMTTLGHRFGNDGVFWMEYSDFFLEFNVVDRTRLFDGTWTIESHWMEVRPNFPATFDEFSFELTVTIDTEAVFVLSQLDRRYFSGLQGQWDYKLEFRILKKGSDTYSSRASAPGFDYRSISTELPLEAGTYIIYVRIDQRLRSGAASFLEVISRQDVRAIGKLLRIAKNYEDGRKQASNVSDREENIWNAIACCHGSLDGKRPTARHSFRVSEPTEIQGDIPDRRPEAPKVTIGLRVYTHDPKAQIEGHINGLPKLSSRPKCGTTTVTAGYPVASKLVARTIDTVSQMTPNNKTNLDKDLLTRSGTKSGFMSRLMSPRHNILTS